MKTAIVSDLHLGATSQGDLMRLEPILDRFIEASAGCERLVLLGDTIELRDRPIEEAMDMARPFFERVGREFSGGEIVLVPGNHDHRLLGHWLERMRADDGNGFDLDEEVDAPHAYGSLLAQWLGETKLTMRYPGVWLRDDIYATHGHYLDSHITLPTLERLSVATVDRIGGRPTGRRSKPQDYEEVHAPIYDLLFDLAQGARNPHSHGRNEDGKPPSMRLWEMLGGASGRARNWRGRILSSAVVPAALRGLERAGIGSFGGDFSLAEIGRSGVEAMQTVVERLSIDADHVVFGHIHRRGPLPGEDGRSATDPPWERRGVQLHNTGCWLYVEAMLGRSSSDSPFWPGRMIIVGDEGEPEVIEVLGDVPGHELQTLTEREPA